MELALRFNGEIINADAMQMYQGLPVITNKIPSEERKEVPHHLLGCVGLEDETWRVGVFKKKARGVIEEIRARGRIPILVGGTHYYTQALLFDDEIINDAPGADQGQEPCASEEDQKWPLLDACTEDMLAMLREVDPVMAERWHPNDRRKIRRSLEIWLQHGKKASDLYLDQQARKLNGITPADRSPGCHNIELVEDENHLDNAHSVVPYQTLILWTHAALDILKARLDKRVERMLCNGLLTEVESMELFYSQQLKMGHPVDKSSGIWVSIGYKEFENYSLALRSGDSEDKALEVLKQEAIEQTKSATRHYAKRQIRWIRIKLINAAKEAGMAGNLFLLVASDLARWSEEVEQPAISLSRKFLEGADLPDPRTLSKAAQEYLTPRRDFDMSDRRDLWVKRTCEICATTVLTEDAWNRHMKSRRHRRATRSHYKKHLRETQNEASKVRNDSSQDSAT